MAGTSVAGSEPAPSLQERIIDATFELIEERGLGGVTMAAVARAAAVSRQTLYNHFGDIESIVAAAIERHRVESQHMLVNLLEAIASPTDQLAHLVRHTAALALEGHPMLRHGFSPAIQQTIAASDEHLRLVIERILNDGSVAGVFRADLDPARDAVLIQRMIEATGELVAGDPDNAAPIATTAIRTVKAAVAAT